VGGTAQDAGEQTAARHDVVVDRGVRIATPDGAELVGDVFHPVDAPHRATLLQRTPYGRAFLEPEARAYAARGFDVVSQDCRGSGQSTGAPSFFAEGPDGRLTADWIAAQAWSAGPLVPIGASYMGFTALAVAATRPPGLAALAIQIAASDRCASWFPGGTFALDIALPWSQIRAATRDGLFDLSDLDAVVAQMEEAGRRLEQAFLHLPLGGSDAVAVGETLPWFQEWMDHPDPRDPYWAPIDLRAALVGVAVPTLLIDGWYDYQVPHMLADHRGLLAAGVPTRLVVGPWSHPTVDGLVVQDEVVAWLDRHLGRVDTDARAEPPSTPVRVFVQPEVGWTELASWPPPGTTASRWHLQPLGGLAPEPAPASSPDAYDYDPADPTPSYGGTGLRMPPASGPVDNRRLEARPDVLTFTSAALDHDLDVLGPVTAVVHITSSTPHTDVFVRLCDVAPDGTSTNVCDGIRRLLPGDPAVQPDGSRRVELALWDTAYRFGSGHRIRVQVSSGAHPRFARNLGAGEPLGTGTTLVVAHQQVHHDPDHPSSVTLEVRAR
jgi:uncharacterized protein